MARYKKKRIEYIPIEEMIERLSWCKQYRNLKYGARVGKENHKYSVANVVCKITRIELTYRLCDKTTTYIARLDGSTDTQTIDGVTAYATLQKYYKVPDLSEDERFRYTKEENGQISWIIQSAKQLQFYSLERNNQRHKNCIGYDLNSSFSYAMLKPIPNTEEEPRFYGEVGPNEIGFLHNGDVVFEGRANIIFPLMESPFKRFVNTWYKRKVEAKNPKEKDKAKSMLNYCIGYLQRKNPFIRNTIVWRSNKLIKDLIDNNTIYCNTDSIVSLVKRPDIEKNLGTDIGQWKIEHKGDFAYREFTYQWSLAVPTYKGIPKEWFKQFEDVNGRKWDLMEDPPPNSGFNLYYFDEEKLEIIKKEVKYEKGKETNKKN